MNGNANSLKKHVDCVKVKECLEGQVSEHEDRPESVVDFHPD